MRRLEILDTTMRDGAQGHNINYSLEDKLQIYSLLKGLGIKYIEIGNPASNPMDKNILFNKCESQMVAFGSTRRKNLSCSEDNNIITLANTPAMCITIFGKSSSEQVTGILNCSLEENLLMVEESIKYLVEKGKQVIFDAEHFFDGYKINSKYAIDSLKTAYLAGASTLVLCDTNGASFPQYVGDVTKIVVELFPKAQIGIHTHNDCGLAVANTMSAVEAGATHIQGTMLGTGERCGNACLSTLIPSLQLKCGYDILTSEQLSKLTSVCRYISELTNLPMQNDLPYVGDNAFVHKAGMHCDGVIKNSASFEHINPDLVGNRRNLLVSLLSGKASVMDKIKTFFPNIIVEEEQLHRVLELIKTKETEGYTYDGAEASFYLMCSSILGIYSEFFKLINYKIVCDQTGNNSAIVKLEVNNCEKLSSGEGLGPVHALDKALRQGLRVFFPLIDKVSLIDYKVRVLDTESATGAKVRVLVTSSDEHNSWTTVGVSNDIIQASFTALADAFNYYLTQNN